MFQGALEPPQGPWSVPGRHKVLIDGALKCLDNIPVLEYCLHNMCTISSSHHRVGFNMYCVAGDILPLPVARNFSVSSTEIFCSFEDIQ